MAAIGTITELSKVQDIVTDVASGTGRRRVRIFFRGVSGATSDTLNLATYFPGLQGIERVITTYDEVMDFGAADTWSGTTITFGNHTGSGRVTLDIIAYY